MSVAMVAGIAAVVAFALALYAVREAISLKTPAERIGRWALLTTAAGGGALLMNVSATLAGALWAGDPLGIAIAELPARVLVTLGVILGLAAVVLGPVLKDAVVLVIRRKAKAIVEKPPDPPEATP